MFFRAVLWAVGAAGVAIAQNPNGSVPELIEIASEVADILQHKSTVTVTNKVTVTEAETITAYKTIYECSPESTSATTPVAQSSSAGGSTPGARTSSSFISSISPSVPVTPTTSAIYQQSSSLSSVIVTGTPCTTLSLSTHYNNSSTFSTARLASSTFIYPSNSTSLSSSSISNISAGTSTSKTSTLTTSSSSCAATTAGTYVNQTICNGNTYTYQELAGYGFHPGNATDSYGDTIGGIGSGIALDRKAWTKLANGSYTGVLWAQPDRGWNTEGTLNYQARIHKFNILFTPEPCATVENPSGPNLILTYDNTVLYYGPDGTTPTTGLDADGSGHYLYPGFPDLPISTYYGDGFGSSGSKHQRIPLDDEGLVLGADGTFWVSDEYGPYIYHFSAEGTMLAAIRPPDAFIPMRNGSESFSADSPYYYMNHGSGDDVSPADNPTGRDNNHGFEGFTISADGETLFVLLQAAANQEGGLSKQTERYTRFVKYDISGSTPKYLAEWVVPLPLYDDPTAKKSKNPKTAAQSEIFHITDEQFLVLARDSNFGHGQSNSLSVYRHADIFDISSATNIAGSTYDCANCSVASLDGVLDKAITPATYCSFLDFNVNSQLQRFGLHNGGDQDQYLLNEKWESLALVPVDGENGADGEYFLFSMSDNDFITQDGHLNGGSFTYADDSGYNLDSQTLVFKITLPSGVQPIASI